MKLICSLFLLCFFISLSSCDKDETLAPDQALNNALDGDWEWTSIIAEGDEYINDYREIKMEFDAEDQNTGECEWIFVETDGSREVLRFDYEIDDDGEEIEFTLTSEGMLPPFDMEVEVDGDELEMEGFVSSEAWRIRAERD